MRYLRKLCNLWAVIGMFVILGTVGHADYMDSIGQYCSITLIFRQLLVGIALMMPSITIHICGGNNGK